MQKLENAFLSALSALRCELPNLVVVGGWCPYLYATYLWKKKIPNIPTTMDIDLGVVEVGPNKSGATVYDRLKQVGLAMERLYSQESEPIEFIYKQRHLEMRLEFLTSFETSDDTLNRFLGQELACHRLEAFEVLLQDPLTLEVGPAAGRLPVRVPRPAMFLFHKGITFTNRSEEVKRDKDLFYIYFMLRFAPSRKALLGVILGLKSHGYFEVFRKNLADYFSDPSCTGYLALRPFLSRWVEERDINREIEETFRELTCEVL